MNIRANIFLSLYLLIIYCSQSHAALMTFDSLPDDFSEISTYTEDGLTLFALAGAPDHFHSDTNPDNGTTGVSIFSDDGTPQRIIFNHGQPFTLLRLDVWGIDALSGPIVFSTSTGATQTVVTTGPLNFGVDFQNIDFVQIDTPDPGNDRFIGIDNILAQPVPESSSLILLSLATACLLGWHYVQRWLGT